MNYVTTATKIFEDNQKVGWWTDKETGKSLVGNRGLGMISALIHSELSEAMEGVRKNLQDDHLPNRPMVEVEIADAAIRAFDFLGSELSVGNLTVTDSMVDDSRHYVKSVFSDLDSQTPVDYIAGLHSIVSNAYTDSSYGIAKTDKDREQANWSFGLDCVSIIAGCEEMSEKFGYDLTGAIEEKLAYNANRADHKLENRQKEGGKQF